MAVMSPQPSAKVKRAAWTLLEFVRRSIRSGMDEPFYSVTRPAQLHDELKHFLEAYDDDRKYEKRRKKKR